jgi:hypothetical protein
MSDRPGPIAESPAPSSPAPGTPPAPPVTSANNGPAPQASSVGGDPAPQVSSLNGGPAPRVSSVGGDPVEISDEPFALVEPADPVAEEKTPPSRAKKIVLSGLLAVTVAGLGFLSYVGWSVASEKDTTISTPEKIGNLTLDSSADGRSTADYLQSALAAEVGLDKGIGGVYAEGSTDKKVLFFGGTALIWSPKSDLKTAFDLIGDDSAPITALHDVDPGSLGGEMMCGNTKVDETTMTVCGWADHGSLAMAMLTGVPETESATLMRQLRDATQKRN